MGRRLDENDLRRRAIGSVRSQVEAFGSAHHDSLLIRRPGLLAAVVPSSPQRSFFNSVFYDDPAALSAEVESLEGTYESHGVGAWTVWVPDEDRESAGMLRARGHSLDAAPRAMAMELADLGPEPPAPDGIEPGPIEASTCAALNEPIGCLGTIEVGDDCLVTGVATPLEHRGRGIASWLLWHALAEAHARGLASTSLQASRSGAPLYERIGFRDLGFIEMWEMRR
jgi:GNAT superfamily N-acetyltransferase